MPIITETKDRVLDAAEKSFSSFGFAGASMKGIALDAGVAQGLLHYHFNTKEGLYRGVIARRSESINEARFALLAMVDVAAPDALERVFEAFLAPPFDSERVAAGYTGMLARLVVGGDLDQELVSTHYDNCAEQFIDALVNLLPSTERTVLAQCYLTSIGAMIAALAPAGRAEKLACQANPPMETPAQTVARLVTFCASGTRALSS